MTIGIRATSKMLFALRCMTNFNTSNRRYKPSSRIIDLMKKAIRNSPISEQHSLNISNAQMGKQLSQKHRDAISRGLVGRVHSEETKLQISKSNKGLKRSEETRKKISQSKMGKPLSDVHKAILSLKTKGRKVSKETCLSIKKSQEKFTYTIITPLKETVKIYNLKDWCIQNNLSYSGFSAMSRKGGKTKGYLISRMLK
jgi:hypothetical protein